MDRYKFGEFIYQKRKSLGLTQEELGRRVGVTNKAVSKWEVGETLPDVMMLEPLAQVLQVTVDELLSHKDKKEDEKKNIKVNKILYFVIIGLVILEIVTVILFVILNREVEEQQQPIKFTEDNYLEIVTINPLSNISCEDQSVIVESTYSLCSDYLVDEKGISFVVVYRFNYYYYRNDGTLGVVTYYNRILDVNLINGEENQSSQISLKPQVEIQNFKGFRNIEIEYSVYDITGSVIEKAEVEN